MELELVCPELGYEDSPISAIQMVLIFVWIWPLVEVIYFVFVVEKNRSWSDLAKKTAVRHKGLVVSIVFASIGGMVMSMAGFMGVDYSTRVNGWVIVNFFTSATMAAVMRNLSISYREGRH